MKKNSRIAAIAAAFFMLCAFGQTASAQSVDSSASGVYLGSDRVCRVVLSGFQTHWVQAHITCLTFAGAQSASLTTIYAPGSCPQGGAYSITPWAPREYLSLRSYDATDQVLQIVLGLDQTAVYNGIGTAEAWYRIGWAPSPSPYTCATTGNGWRR